jgi:hypothetical protein
VSDEAFLLQYLPLFEQDLASAREYIAKTLQNPIAASRLVDETDRAIKRRLINPLGFQQYHSKRDRLNPYYRIQVRNYTVFYVVIGNIMEVRRFVYSRRNLPEIV